jgi:hypothetical protein
LPSSGASSTLAEMRTITAILEPSEDGTLHLPLPKGLPAGKIEVIAQFRALSENGPEEAGFKVGCLKGFWMAPDFDAPLEDFAEYS